MSNPMPPASPDAETDHTIDLDCPHCGKTTTWSMEPKAEDDAEESQEAPPPSDDDVKANIGKYMGS